MVPNRQLHGSSLFCDGRRISDDHTADQLQVEDGDELEFLTLTCVVFVISLVSVAAISNRIVIHLRMRITAVVWRHVAHTPIRYLSTPLSYSSALITARLFFFF